MLLEISSQKFKFYKYFKNRNSKELNMSVEKKIRDILEGKKEAEKLAESAIENKKDETISEEQTEVVVAEEKKEEVSF